LRPLLRTFSADDYVIVHSIEFDDGALILHVAPGSDDIRSIFSH
jgi:hypothetical protein